MTEKYIVYRDGDDIYDIAESDAAEFESQYPNATMEMHDGDDIYDVSPADKDEFLSQYPNAIYTFDLNNEPEMTRREKKKARREEKANDDKVTLGETIKYSIGNIGTTIGKMLYDSALADSSRGVYIDSKTGEATRLKDLDTLIAEDDYTVQISQNMRKKAEEFSKKADPTKGEKDYIDLLKEGKLGTMLQKSVGDALQSAPATIAGTSMLLTVPYVLGTAASSFVDQSVDNPDIPAWKRGVYALGTSVFEQFVERFENPFSKGAGKELTESAAKEILEEGVDKGVKKIADRIFSVLKRVGKAAKGEGIEEGVTGFGNDLIGQALDWIDGDKDYGFTAQWEQLKEENPDADMMDFAIGKAREYTNAAIGGALSGAHMSGPTTIVNEVASAVREKDANDNIASAERVGDKLDYGNMYDTDSDVADAYAELEKSFVNENGEATLTPEFLNSLSANEALILSQRNELSDQQRTALANYAEKKAVQEGLDRKLTDRVNNQINANHILIDEASYEDGTVIAGNVDGRNVYVIGAKFDKGKLTSPNGNSGPVVVLDANTGERFASSTDKVIDVRSLNAESLKNDIAQMYSSADQKARETARNTMSQRAKIRAIQPFAGKKILVDLGNGATEVYVQQIGTNGDVLIKGKKGDLGGQTFLTLNGAVFYDSIYRDNDGNPVVTEAGPEVEEQVDEAPEGDDFRDYVGPILLNGVPVDVEVTQQDDASDTIVYTYVDENGVARRGSSSISEFKNAIQQAQPVTEVTPETEVAETPVEEAPVDETSVEETPVEKVPVEETPAPQPIDWDALFESDKEAFFSELQNYFGENAAIMLEDFIEATQNELDELNKAKVSGFNEIAANREAKAKVQTRLDVLNEMLQRLAPQPVEKTPVAETPAPVEEAPAPVEEIPVEESPVAETHIEEQPVVETPAPAPATPANPVAPKSVANPIQEAQKRERSLATQLKRVDISPEQKMDMAFNAGKAIGDLFATREEYEAYAENATDLGEYNSDFERGVDESFANRGQNSSETPKESAPLDNQPNTSVLYHIGEMAEDSSEVKMELGEQVAEWIKQGGNFVVMDSAEMQKALEEEGIPQNSKRRKRILYNSDLSRAEKRKIKEYILSLSLDSSFDGPLMLKADGYAYIFNTSVRFFKDNTTKKPKGDGFEILHKYELSSLTELEEKLLDATYNYGEDSGNLDEMLQILGINKRGSSDSSSANSNIGTEGGNGRLDEAEHREQTSTDRGYNGGRRDSKNVQALETPDGIVYGFVKDGVVYLDPTLINPNTAIHEYTHLWDNALMQLNPELWEKGKALMKQTPLWDEVINDPNYADIKDNEDLVASEVHSRLVGKDGAARLEMLEQEAREKGLTKNAKQISILGRLREWLNEATKWLKDAFTKWEKSELDKLSIDDFLNMPLRDLANFRQLPKEGIITNANGEVIADNKGKGKIQFSISTWEQGGRDYLVNWLNNDKTLDADEKADIVARMDEFYENAKKYTDVYVPFGTWSDAAVKYDSEGSPIMSVIKANGDYAMNLDFSLVCKKRRPLNRLLRTLINRNAFGTYSLKERELAEINWILQEHGFEVACALCFVDAKRYRVTGVADVFATLYNNMVKALAPEGAEIAHFNYNGNPNVAAVENGLDTMADDQLNWEAFDKLASKFGPNTVEGKVAKFLRENPSQRKLVDSTDFIEADGFEAVKTNNPALLSLYNSKKGQAGPKASFGDVQYLNDILKNDKKFDVEKAYSVGGVRLQSFSDFVPHMYFDYMQLFAELAAKRLPAHAYTKEVLFAKIFGMTGMKINMSLVPAVAEDGIAPGLDKDGNYVWSDAIKDKNGNVIQQGQTFPYDDAVAIQNAEGYSKNCGIIAVGISDEHITKMLNDGNIPYIIPYHKSALNAIVARMTNIDKYKNYEKDQNTRDSNGAKLAKGTPDFNFNEYLHTHEGATPQQAAQAYLDWCRENNYIPKFSQFAYHPNYYKLLADFNTMDLRTGEYAPQGAVKMDFPIADSPFGDVESLIKQGLQEDAETDEKMDTEMEEVADEVEDMLKRVASEPKMSAKKKAEHLARLADERTAKINEMADSDGILSRSGDITPEMDAEYLAAVETGDMETAQRLVLEAAKIAMPNTKVLNSEGYPRKVWHGTVSGGFAKFREGWAGIFFSDSRVGIEDYTGGKNQDVSNFFPFDSSKEGQLEKVNQWLKVSKSVENQKMKEVVEADGLWRIVDKETGEFRKNDDGSIFEDSPEIVMGIIASNDIYESPDFNRQGIYTAYINIEDPFVIDAEGKHWWQLPKTVDGITISDDYLPIGSEYASTDEWVNYLRSEGMSDGLIVKRVRDSHTARRPITDYVLFNPLQIKSADVVTYDDNGNVIPLSERFNPENPDIRYRTINEGETNLEFVQSAVADFLSQYKSPVPMTAVDVNDRAAVEKAVGFEEGELSDESYKMLVDKVGKGGNSIYIADTKRIIIFADNRNVVSAEVEDSAFHEITHALADKNPAILELGGWLWNNADKGVRKRIKDAVISEGYPAEQQHNEMLARFTGSILAVGRAGEVSDMLPAEQKKHWDYILNEIGYEQRKDDEPRARRFADDSRRAAIIRQNYSAKVSDNGDARNAKEARQNEAVGRLVGTARNIAIENAVNEEAAKLGVKVTYKTREEMPAGHKNDKGYYNTKTGEIVVCTENASSISDAIQTILHEAIAHKGLRQLMGDRFNEFINRVYDSLDSETKAKVDALAEKSYNGNKAVAMEEYLASLAETEDFAKNSVWDKVKSIFENIINAILGRNDIKIGDNELRYILRASYNHMVNPRGMDSLRGWAQDQMMREEYGIGMDSDKVAKLDAEYLAAVESGDMETAQRFVNEAAKLAMPNTVVVDENGYPKVIYHGTNNEFFVFGEDLSTKQSHTIEGSYYFNDNSEVAGTYGKRVIPVFVNIEDPLVVDFEGRSWRNLVYGGIVVYYERTGVPLKKGFDTLEEAEAWRDDFLASHPEYAKDSDYVTVREGMIESQGKTSDEYVEMAMKEGRDGAILNNITDSADVEHLDTKVNDYVTFSSSQIKSAEAVTYDDNGNVIPLSKRFNLRNDDIRYRTGIDPDEVAAESARETYDRVVTHQWQEFQRQFQDAMQPVRIAIDAIQQETGNIPIEDYENYLLIQNQSSSRSRNEINLFERQYYDPIYKQVSKIIDMMLEARHYDKTDETKRAEAYAELKQYLIAKHGLERNEYYQTHNLRKLKPHEKAREMKAAKDAYDEAVRVINEDTSLSDTERQLELYKAKDVYDAAVIEIQTREVPDLRDYSGLTSLFGLAPKKFKEAEQEAQILVDNFEAGLEGSDVIDTLWEKINAATSRTLRHSYESGLISRAQYEDIKNMFKFYIPLRGFDETTAEDVYSYARFEGNSFNPAVQKAGGRTSVADDPIAFIMNMAESEIAQGNKNRAKQALYNYLLNRTNKDAEGNDEQNSLMQVESVWYEVKEDQSGQTVHVIATPDRAAGETYEDFENRMLALEQENKAYKSKRGKVSVGMRFQKPKNMDAHYIYLKVNGVEKAIYVNGDPKAADAVNGKFASQPTNAEKMAKDVNRFVSSMFTNYSLEFTVRNFLRDLVYSRINIGVKEDGEYGIQFRKNFWRNNPIKMVSMLVSYRAGEFDNADLTEDQAAFVEFMNNGGQTGYTLINSVENHKKDLERAIKRMQKGLVKGGIKDSTAFKYTLGGIELLNEASELTTRFAAFKTSRDLGRPIHKSVSDAKEISVNFNTKGAQDGNSVMGVIARYFGAAKYFFNASVQGVQNIGAMAQKNAGKFGATVGTMIAFGAMWPMINTAILSLITGDDEDDEYWKIPEYDRQNNLCIVLGNGRYIKIALPIGFREMFGIGDMAMASITGKTPRDPMQWGKDFANKIANIALPINPLEGTVNGLSLIESAEDMLIPDVAQFILQNRSNKDWKGAPIQKEYTYNQDDPQWTKAFSGNPAWLTGFCKWMNENFVWDGLGVDWSPEKIDNTLSNVFGGTYSLVKKTGRMVSSAINAINGEDEFSISSIPVVGVFTGKAGEDSFVTSTYWNMEDYYSKRLPTIKRTAASFGYTLDEVFARTEDGEARAGEHQPAMSKIYNRKNFDFMQEWYLGHKGEGDEENLGLDQIKTQIDRYKKAVNKDEFDLDAKEMLAEYEMMLEAKRRDLVNDLLELD